MAWKPCHRRIIEIKSVAFGKEQLTRLKITCAAIWPGVGSSKRLLSVSLTTFFPPLYFILGTGWTWTPGLFGVSFGLNRVIFLMQAMWVNYQSPHNDHINFATL